MVGRLDKERTRLASADFADLLPSAAMIDRRTKNLEEALKVDPKFAPGSARLGRRDRQAGNKADAKRCYEEASAQTK